MKKTLLILAILGFSVLCVNAEEFTVSDSQSREYLENNGYSGSTVTLVERSRARAYGEEYTKPEENPIYEEKPVKWLRKFWMYVDPCLDNDSFMNHNMQTSPSLNDL